MTAEPGKPVRIEISGNAKAGIDSCNNDIFLAASGTSENLCKIKILPPGLSGVSTVAVITPARYTVGRKVPEAGDGVNLNDEAGKFKVTPDGANRYLINGEGKLQRKP